LVRSLDDPDPLVRRLAGEALEAIGNDGVPALLEVMGNGSHVARLEAARALAAIGDTRAIPALFAPWRVQLLEYWARVGAMGVGMNYFFQLSGSCLSSVVLARFIRFGCWDEQIDPREKLVRAST
jgi:hypothetical protein